MSALPHGASVGVGEAPPKKKVLDPTCLQSWETGTEHRGRTGSTKPQKSGCWCPGGFLPPQIREDPGHTRRGTPRASSPFLMLLIGLLSCIIQKQRVTGLSEICKSSTALSTPSRHTAVSQGDCGSFIYHSQTEIAAPQSKEPLTLSSAHGHQQN